MALGHVALMEVIDQLVNERSRQHPQVSLFFTARRLARSYGDSVDLTIYRCIQESLTNAIRHAQAKHITVGVYHDEVAALLELTVHDDGCGMSAPMQAGFGIRGIQERIEALGGHYDVESEAGYGTLVRIAIPLGKSIAAATEPDQKWHTQA